MSTEANKPRLPNDEQLADIRRRAEAETMDCIFILVDNLCRLRLMKAPIAPIDRHVALHTRNALDGMKTLREQYAARRCECIAADLAETFDTEYYRPRRSQSAQSTQTPNISLTAHQLRIRVLNAIELIGRVYESLGQSAAGRPDDQVIDYWTDEEQIRADGNWQGPKETANMAVHRLLGIARGTIMAQREIMGQLREATGTDEPFGVDSVTTYAGLITREILSKLAPWADEAFRTPPKYLRETVADDRSRQILRFAYGTGDESDSES